jgi:FtsP/CotA-like multicopper oxidase with cupredoxin domain
MSQAISRRDFFGATLAAAVLPTMVRLSSPRPKRLMAGTRVLEVNGRPARVFGLVGPDGRSGIRLAPGEHFHVELANETGVRTIVHWHGQLPPWTQDGFPWPQTPPLAPGETHGYDFAPIPGTFWMHSHQGLQEQSLMTAPLIVHDAGELREDRQEVVLMLHDFSFRAPDELLAGLAGISDAAAHAMSRLIENVPAPGGNAAKPHSIMAMSPGMTAASEMSNGAGTGMVGSSRPGSSMPGAAMPGSSMPGSSMPGSSMPGSSMPGMGAIRMDLNDVDYDAFLANDRTLADPEIVRVERGGRIRLRIINGASSSQFWIDLGELVGRLVATDGHRVHPVAGSSFPIAIAQRLDILIDLPRTGTFPILARLEGTGRQTGIVLATAGAQIPRLVDNAQAAPPLDNSLETRLAAMTPLLARPADLVRTISLDGGMKPYAWSMNGEYWPRTAPLMLSKGERVEIELVNHSIMAHPIHLHGHAFQVVAIDGRPIQGAVRDTVLVTPMMGSVRIAFDANNPGRWAFHCHNLYHMMTGMMMEFRYQGIAA